MLTDFPNDILNSPSYTNYDMVGLNSLVQIKAKSHYDLGLQISKIHKHKSVPKFSKINKIVYEQQYKIYKRYYPEYLEVIEGIADGLKVNIDKLTNCFISMNEPISGCSIINCNGLVGRNYDWYSDAIRTIELFAIDVKNYNKIIAIREGGFPDDKKKHTYVRNEIHPISGCVDFINNKFLYVGILFMHYTGKIYEGLFVLDFIHKMAETCNNILDVMKFLKKTPCNTPKFIFVSDRKGNSVIIEHYTGFNYYVREPVNNILIQTNHILNPTHIKYDKKKFRKESKNRYKYMEDKCKNKALDYLDVKTILDSKEVFAIYNKKPSTIYQIIMNLSKKKIYLFTKYKVYQLQELF
jgi:predicted choloylglycine hydrolase